MLLNYKQSGSGEDVIVIHGLFGSLENLNVIAKSLAENYRVTNIDLRNHGQSFHDAQMDYQVMARDVIHLMEHLKINKAHIIGHSMGGKVAMKLALTEPSLVDKLIVLDIAPVTYKPRHDAIFAGLNAVEQAQVQDRKSADTILAQYVNELGVRQFLLKSFAKNESGEFSWRFNLAVLFEKYENILTDINENNSCSCDTLFIKGNDSDYILPEYRDAIMAHFPKAKAKIIHGAGHWLHAQKPQAVNKSIDDFLGA